MKKSILTLLSLLICAVQPITAYEYFTIYFSDGTKSEAFYATDVDSICYSKFSLESIAYDDWQVQEIYTCDSVYRYPLAQIDSLSFKDVDENKVAEDIARVSNMIDPLYLQSRTLSEIAQHIPAILNTEGVEDVWMDNQTLFIKIRYWGTITYTYPVGFSISNTSLSRSSIGIRKAARETSGHSHINYKVKACIFDQTYKNDDEEYRKIDPIIDAMSNQFDYMGIPCNIENGNNSFFNGNIFKYDLVFLITHGEYDAAKNLHWIYTCEEVSTSNADNIFYDVEAWIKFFKNHHQLSSDLMSIGTLFEIRNGKPIVVHYVKVSNKYISSLKSKFNNYGKAMIFNVACQSLKGPGDKMELGLANAFVKKGAGCYLGYTDTNGIGPMGGEYFFYGLMNGMSAESAYNTIPDDWKRQVLLINGNTYKPELKIIPETSNELCITHPETLSAETNGQEVILRGQIAMINTQELVGNYKYGFCIADNPDMNDAKKDSIEGKFDRETLQMKWEKTLDKSALQPNTTYYYRAYMNDGYSDCYGEIKNIGSVPYCVLKDSTLTFYYDGKKEEQDGLVFDIDKGYGYNNSGEWIMPKWRGYDDNIITSNFDVSFKDYYPKSTACWFYSLEKMTQIRNLEYLKTDSVTNMGSMFTSCSSLTSLDLSSFNTSNVTNMGSMFRECESLTNLDSSSFNTSKVTNMSCMFNMCESLKELDLSHFNTENVTDMHRMFYWCFSLEKINLSSFKTSKVTDMAGMFSNCRSLKDLDVSSFDTSNLIDMSGHKEPFDGFGNYDGMFAGCSSLSSIDLSNFDTSKVTDMHQLFQDCTNLKEINMSGFVFKNTWSYNTFFDHCDSLTSINFSNGKIIGNAEGLFSFELLKEINLSDVDTSEATDLSGMFGGCKSLTSLDVSSFNTANVRNMNGMFVGCSSLTSLDVSSFNTSNVTDMRDMFSYCISLTSLDVSSFSTANVRNMYGMFSQCSSLRTIFAGDWNVKNNTVMFSGCEKLVGGKGTKLGQNFYGYDKDGKPLYYYCSVGGEVAHIDGGKDNPGLFTAK